MLRVVALLLILPLGGCNDEMVVTPLPPRAPLPPVPGTAAMPRPAPTIIIAPSPATAAPTIAAPRDPWTTPAPADLLTLRRATQRGPLNDNQLERLRAIARRDAEDPRPLLLLAHVLVDRNSWTDALNRYSRAHAMDPTIRGDQDMQRDLVRMTRSPLIGPTALRTLERIYGPDLPAILESIAAGTPQRSERTRIESLRSSLTN